MTSSCVLAASQEIWKGFVPIVFILADSDLTSSSPPDEVHVLGPRMAYIPVIAADVIDYLRDFAIEFSNEVWFEYEGQPLRSNIPLGVLYDLYHNEDSLGPWRIICHFQGYPTNKIVKCSTRELAEKFYSHSLKQALFVVEGSTRAFNNLAVEQQEQLWEGCNSGSRGIYEQVARSLRPTAEAIRAIPVRVMFQDKPTAQRPVSVLTKMDTSSRMEGFQEIDSEGITSTSGHCPTLLRHVVEPILSSIRTKTKTDNSNIDTTLSTQVDAEPGLADDIILIHGVEVPLHAPIYELWVLFAHADLFLYIVVRPRT